MRAKPRTIDEYLAAVNKDQRSALEKLRKAIRAAAPKAEECISYGLAAFRLEGRSLVAFGAAAKHCAFYPMSSTTVLAHKEILKGYETSRGTIRFSADKPLPVALVKKLVKARIAENEGRAKPAARTPKNPQKGTSAKRPEETSAVDEFLRNLNHPLKPVLEAVRQIILGTSPGISEGIKWNAPSFHFKEYFATTGVQAQDFVRIVFHKGAKVKDNATTGMHITDPAGLLEWHAPERCSATFYDMKDLQSKKAALQEIVKQWIKQM
jgi:uncharacterized protein YdhG (YjbR/CyaY superfamily)